MSHSYIITSESVTEGHPDKICDQISDAVLDCALQQDPQARVAVETLVTTGLCIVAGEMTTECYVPVAQLARQTVRDIGYTRAKYGFDCDTMGVLVAIDEQSPDIARGVNTGGAGDQGMMYGYATNETPELMPLPIMLAHRLAKQLAEVRKNRTIPYLRPDGKTQVSVRYNHDKPVEVTKVLLAAQHAPGTDQAEMRAELIEYVVKPVIPKELVDGEPEVLVNRTGKFEVGGPQGDTGLTGRKIIVDTYGGVAWHGGGAFSGKDPTKVDRSGSYMMRYVAKNIVAAGLAERCSVQVAYSIGDAEPFSIQLWTFGTNRIDEAKIADLILEHFDLTPTGMINTLNLRRPIYKKTAVYGHFGRLDPDFTWERTDRAEDLRRAAGL
ncbi:MAG: methionine adenosyltransferase [Candidatus Zipacnadales bacterium]